MRLVALIGSLILRGVILEVTEILEPTEYSRSKNEKIIRMQLTDFEADKRCFIFSVGI